MRQQPWGEAGGAHTQEVDKVFIGPTRALIVSRGLTTKRVSDSLGVPKFTAIKFASVALWLCPIPGSVPFTISLSRVTSRVPSVGPDAPSERRIPLFPVGRLARHPPVAA